MATETNIVDEVVNRGQFGSSSTVKSQIKGYITEIRRELNKRTRHSHTRREGTMATVASQRKNNMSAFSSNVDIITQVINDEMPLDWLPDRKYQKHWWSDTSQGKPFYYRIRNRTIYLLPTPDAAYNISFEYIRRVSAFTSGNQDDYWTDQYPEVVIDGTVAKFKEFAQEYRESDRFLVKFERGVLRIIEEDSQESEESHMEWQMDPVIFYGD